MSPSHWIPIALSTENGEPVVDWADIGPTEFAEPFFDDTIRQWRDGGSARVSRTRLENLTALATDELPSPRAVIFHSSRCGFSLTTRMLSEIAAMQVIAEPAPVNSFLLECTTQLDRTTQVRALRSLGKLIGRPREPRQGPYVLKTSSWNIRYHALFRDAFPGVPMVWIHRNPAHILASLLRKPAGWMDVQHDQILPHALFGISARDAAYMTRTEYCVRALASMFAAASSAVENAMLVLNYAELPDAVWTRLLPFLGIGVDPTSVIRMRHIAKFDAKSGRPVRFEQSHSQLPHDAKALLDQSVSQLYEKTENLR